MAWRWAALGSMSCATALVLRSVASCDSNPSAVQLASEDVGTHADRPTPDSDSDSLPADSAPEDAGDWVHLVGAPDDCEIDVPATAASMPAAIEWEPCGNEIPTVAGCRQMKTPWPVSRVPGAPHIVPLAWGGRTTTGKPLLMFARAEGKYVNRLIAEPDTAVHSAFRENGLADAPRCVLFPYNTTADRFAYVLLEDEADGGARAHAAVLGELGAAARVQSREVTTNPYHPGYLASPLGLIRLQGKLTLRDWDDVDASTFLGPTDEGPPGMIFPQGDAIFWSSGTLAIVKHKVWTRDAGSRDFLSFGADTTQGAADLGTDGSDMVWLEGSARPSPTELFGKVNVKAAPYTSDPSKIVARTLRTDLGPYGFGTTPFVVGCGYAARAASEPALTDGGIAVGTGVGVIRLSDGYQALLAHGPGWTFGTPLLVTCDEVFVNGSKRSAFDFNILRIPLSSLGPWTAP